jgi:hypothetical protein
MVNIWETNKVFSFLSWNDHIWKNFVNIHKWSMVCNYTLLYKLLTLCSFKWDKIKWQELYIKRHGNGHGLLQVNILVPAWKAWRTIKSLGENNCYLNAYQCKWNALELWQPAEQNVHLIKHMVSCYVSKPLCQTSIFALSRPCWEKYTVGPDRVLKPQLWILCSHMSSNFVTSTVSQFTVTNFFLSWYFLRQSFVSKRMDLWTQSDGYWSKLNPHLIHEADVWFAMSERSIGPVLCSTSTNSKIHMNCKETSNINHTMLSSQLTM